MVTKPLPAEMNRLIRQDNKLQQTLARLTEVLSRGPQFADVARRSRSADRSDVHAELERRQSADTGVVGNHARRSADLRSPRAADRGTDSGSPSSGAALQNQRSSFHGAGDSASGILDFPVPRKVPPKHAHSAFAAAGAASPPPPSGQPQPSEHVAQPRRNRGFDPLGEPSPHGSRIASRLPQLSALARLIRQSMRPSQEQRQRERRIENFQREQTQILRSIRQHIENLDPTSRFQ